MKKICSLLLVLPFLLGCNKQEYKGPKIKVEYNATGDLISSAPEYMYTHAFQESVSSIFYIGDDTCSGCAKLKPQLKGWCEVYHGAIYYIPWKSVTEDNEHYLIDATTSDGIYGWKHGDSVPAVFFFMDGYVVNRTSETDTMSYLMKYVEVNNN